MVTSIGHDAKTSCASFRAGVSRASALDYFEAFSEAEDELLAITGHCAATPAVETEGIGKMLTLGAAALRDLLCRSVGPAQGPTDETGIYLALPNYSCRQGPYIDVNQALSPDALPASADDDGGNAAFSVEFARQCRDHLVTRMFKASEIRLHVHRRHCVFGDQSAFLLAIHAAMRDLEQGRVQRCIVGGIDSYLDPDSLSWALDARRLRYDGQPCGFAPGEAAVFLELATPEAALRANKTIRALLSLPTFAHEPHASDGDTAPQGEGLAAAIAQTMSASPQADVGLVVTALNGEVDRAQDWGFALHRLIASFPAFRRVREWIPAASWGETGCAAPGLAMGLGAAAFRRDYAKTDHILVMSTGDSGIRGAAMVSRPA